MYCGYRNLYTQGAWPVTPKSVPLKSVRPDRFWQKNWSPRTTFAAKIGPAGPILAAKTCPPWGPILEKIYLPKLVPPQLRGTVICVRGWVHRYSYSVLQQVILLEYLPASV